MFKHFRTPFCLLLAKYVFVYVFLEFGKNSEFSALSVFGVNDDSFVQMVTSHVGNNHCLMTAEL